MKMNRKSLATLVSTAMALNTVFASHAMAQFQNIDLNAVQCMSSTLGKEKYSWTIRLAQDLSNKVNAKLSFDALKQSLSVHNEVRDAVKSALSQAISQTVQTISPEIF